MRQHIYTLPEAFIHDRSVPPRWRIYGYMNGFFINGRSCYASNDTIGKELDLKQWAISKAIGELEEMGLIRCERTRRGRTCFLAGSVELSDEGSANTLPPQCDHTISDSVITLPNAVTNADKINLRSKAPPVQKKSTFGRYSEKNFSDDGEMAIDIDSGMEIEEKPKNTKKYPNAREIFGLFENPQASWKLNTTELKHAELLYERGVKNVKGALAFYYEYKDEGELCPQILKPSDLERKWDNLVAYKKRLGL